MNNIFLPTLHLNFDTAIELLRNADNAVADNDSNRDVKFIGSDETPVSRLDWYKWEQYDLILSHNPEHVDLSRVSRTGTCMFLSDHRASFENQLGKIHKAEINNKKLFLTATINDEPLGNTYLGRIKQGTAPGNSVGIDIHKLETVKKATYDIDQETGRRTLKTPALMKAVKWQLLECSAVAIPANGFAFSSVELEGENAEEKAKDLHLHSVEVLGDPGYDSVPDMGSISASGRRQLFTMHSNSKKNIVTIQKETKKVGKFTNLSTDDLIAKCEEFEENIGTLQGQLAGKDAKIEEFQNIIADTNKKNEAIASFRKLIDQATQLKIAGKLTKKEFDDRFAFGEENCLTKLEEDPYIFQRLSGYLEAAQNRQSLLNTSLSGLSQLQEKKPVVEKKQTFESEEEIIDEAFELKMEDLKKKPIRSY